MNGITRTYPEITCSKNSALAPPHPQVTIRLLPPLIGAGKSTPFGTRGLVNCHYYTGIAIKQLIFTKNKMAFYINLIALK